MTVRNFEQIGSEKEFLETYREELKDKYEKPSVTVDSVLLRYHEGQPQVLLIKRKTHPFKDCYALSGGFVEKDEDLDQAIRRQVKKETNVNLTENQIEQLITVGTPGRDPRLWVITVAYLCYLKTTDESRARAGDDAASLHWVNIFAKDNQLQLFEDGQALSREQLAFDHWQILETAINRIKGRLEYFPTILQIMPQEETLTAYRELFGCFNENYLKMDSTNFLRRFKRLFTKTDKKKATRTKRAATYTYKIEEL
ncbi:NUDIX domain-containing protein [Streptococcus sobrinus]|uniref:Hydrolase, NUDIX family n=1 Tax=Streptococcus sobrinus W1703 TaxID=1227275 RepID=U2IKG1_9STRE|nr:NUDIX hydrolase [Streptococcus sobrinus]AWN61695.1 NUDIX domain-containing protein [Streptococcus sobrinus]AWN63566.1 NUDIX domain-containing protein [Streptococcus sobrinus]ERJ74386.1 hydrolase, NUDIX family [Streptococcus sobrinus W1703]SQG20155.1 mutT/nudix family protein [Streptococcus sobrinus]